MPWEHCGQQVMDDSLCPACGTSKARWTLRFDKTRRLRLSGDDLDEEAQAIALLGAADDGAPFCEECERARQAEREAAAGRGEDEDAPPPPPPITEPPLEPLPDIQEVQAEGLRDAARTGAPFCEECERARRAQGGGS
jgi:hypothetical protein